MSDHTFYTTSRYHTERIHTEQSYRGRLIVASCRESDYLAKRLVERYRLHLNEAGEENPDILYLPSIDFQFSDGELCARLDTSVEGADVFLMQALHPTAAERDVNDAYMALLIAARTFREHGVSHVTAVLPYLAYARQDKPTVGTREPTTAKLMADLTMEAGIDRLVTWHFHTPQIQGFYSPIAVHSLSPLTLFADQFSVFEGSDNLIVVAPDVGASRMVSRFCRMTDLHGAVATKYRTSDGEAVISQIIGDFSGVTRALIIDDMISSGGTLAKVIEKLVNDKSIHEIHIAASHNLCRADTTKRLSALHEAGKLASLTVTNSIHQSDEFESLPFVTVLDISDTLSRVINRIHYNRSVSELFDTPPAEGGIYAGP